MLLHKCGWCIKQFALCIYLTEDITMWWSEFLSATVLKNIHDMHLDFIGIGPRNHTGWSCNILSYLSCTYSYVIFTLIRLNVNVSNHYLSLHECRYVSIPFLNALHAKAREINFLPCLRKKPHLIIIIKVNCLPLMGILRKI